MGRPANYPKVGTMRNLLLPPPLEAIYDGKVGIVIQNISG